MNVVMIIPTGIGAEIGGHAGDANSAAKLLGACCDTLIVHPNVVNAADINEMPSNSLYVEGSILDRFLEGCFELKVQYGHNKILLVVNSPVENQTINSVNAARLTLGAHIEIIELKTRFRMIATMAPDGSASGEVTGWNDLVNQVLEHDFDALALHTEIEYDPSVALDYMENGGVNPWGGVEAMASKLIANELNKPVAHAPTEPDFFKGYNEIVDPRISAELVSVSYLHCVLKGLHRAPSPCENGDFRAEDIDVLVSPAGCCGRPHRACDKLGIPIIVVEENKTIVDNPCTDIGTISVANYWEAAGYLMAMNAGIDPKAVRRPISSVNVIRS